MTANAWSIAAIHPISAQPIALAWPEPTEYQRAHQIAFALLSTFTVTDLYFDNLDGTRQQLVLFTMNSRDHLTTVRCIDADDAIVIMTELAENGILMAYA